MEEVRLRMLRPSDVETVYRLISNMEVIRWMTFPSYTRADAEAYCTQLQPVVLGPSRHTLDRAIWVDGADEAIGMCGLVVDREREDAEAWYLLDPAWWGKGLALIALRQLLGLGFCDLRLHRIWACCVPVNRRSVRVLEKAGMRYEGHSKLNIRIRGEWHDSLLYALLAEEWEGIGTASPRAAKETIQP